VPLFIGGIFRDRSQAGRVITALLDAGVPSSEISLAVREASEEDVNERHDIGNETVEYAELAVHSAWERLGWQGGARPAYRDVISPDIEFALLAAGPLCIAIGGAQLGACSGGVVGSMGNFGFPLDLAKQWYNHLIDGRAWVMVRTDERSAGRVRPIFEKYNPELPAESLRRW